LPTINGESAYLGFTLSAKGGQNIAWVSRDPMGTIKIVVQDTSGKCPSKYRTASASFRMQNKWSSTANLYTFIMK
jgi:hypothetical protein